MSCVLGMVVERERLISPTDIVPFYGIKADLGNNISAQWKIVKGSSYDRSPDCYKTSGLLQKPPVEDLVSRLSKDGILTVENKDKTQEKKPAPLLFNLAELQAECTKVFRISPADTLDIVQKLYEAKLTTYPRTDARVLTTAVAKVIRNNVQGLSRLPELAGSVSGILNNGLIEKFQRAPGKYVDDSKVSDHYAIIPTGQGFDALSRLPNTTKAVYFMICQRFLSIFYPAAVYDKMTLTLIGQGETFIASFSSLRDAGWIEAGGKLDKDKEDESGALYKAADCLSGKILATFQLMEGKSKPPARYTTGSMILAMENAGSLIEDPDLREQIKGSGIGTSATRAECIKKLEEKLQYINVNKKTQQITPSCMGELVYEVLKLALPNILKPKYTASWETGLQMIVDKKTTKDVYLEKIYTYIRKNVESMKSTSYSEGIKTAVESLKSVYPDIGKAPAGVANGDSGMTCPVCGKPIRINTEKNSLYCTGYKEGCHFSFFTTVFKTKKIPDASVRKLVETAKDNGGGIYVSQTTPPMTLASPSKGTSFRAGLRLIYNPSADKYPKIEFVYDDSDKCPVGKSNKR